jgi:hypothetical protein
VRDRPSQHTSCIDEQLIHNRLIRTVLEESRITVQQGDREETAVGLTRPMGPPAQFLRLAACHHRSGNAADRHHSDWGADHIARFGQLLRGCVFRSGRGRKPAWPLRCNSESMKCIARVLPVLGGSPNWCATCVVRACLGWRGWASHRISQTRFSITKPAPFQELQRSTNAMIFSQSGGLLSTNGGLTLTGSWQTFRTRARLA